MLREAGYHGRRDPKELIVADPRNDVEFFYLRPRDIATYVGSRCARRRHHRPRPAARLRLLRRRDRRARLRRLDVPLRGTAGGRTPTSPTSTASASRRATRASSASSSPTAASTPPLIKLDGAVESAVRLGVADAVADVVETGSTLRKQGLEIFGPVILESEAVLVSSAVARHRSRHAAASPAGRHGRAAVRAGRLQPPRRAARPGRRPDAGRRVAHRLAARRAGLGGRAGHDQARQHQPGHGRASTSSGARAILVTSIHAARI